MADSRAIRQRIGEQKAMVELAEARQRTAWEEGYDARAREALPASANPYARDKDKFRHDEWQRGWDRAHEEA